MFEQSHSIFLTSCGFFFSHLLISSCRWILPLLLSRKDTWVSLYWVMTSTNFLDRTVCCNKKKRQQTKASAYRSKQQRQASTRQRAKISSLRRLWHTLNVTFTTLSDRWSGRNILTWVFWILKSTEAALTASSLGILCSMAAGTVSRYTIRYINISHQGGLTHISVWFGPRWHSLWYHWSGCPTGPLCL